MNNSSGTFLGTTISSQTDEKKTGIWASCLITMTMNIFLFNSSSVSFDNNEKL